MSAIVLCVVWALWPLVAMVGGGAGFAVLVGIAAVLLAPAALKGYRPRIYVGLLLLFFGFAAASTAWSPRPFTFVEINLAKGSFNVRSEVLRLATLILGAGLLLGATMRLDDAGRRRVATVAMFALLAQLVIVSICTLFEWPILNLVRPIVPDTGEGVQNITRNSLIMAAAAPALIAVIAGGRPLSAVSFSAFGVLIVELAILAYRDVDAGILALVAATAAITVTTLLPKNGFRVLGVFLALGIMTAPLLFGFLSHGAIAETATTSAQWRLAIWAKACAVIAQHPLFGAGLGVLRTMRDVIPSGAFAGQLYVPNHPHNMALQLWAETGAVGASLLSAAILAAAFRLPSPRDLGRKSFHVAGLIGGVVAIAFVSFDLWNQDWWAVACLLGVLSAAAPSLVRAVEVVHKPGIVFGQPVATAASFAASGSGGEGQAPAGFQATPVSGVVADAQPSAHLNNFNLLRLIFAVMVAVYHVSRLSGVWPEARPFLEVAAEIGVQGFFVVSGYLVYASLERSPSIGVYASKRVRRLYPAYLVVILVSTAAAIILSPAARGGLGDVARYLGANLVFLNFLEPNLPGVFDHNPVTEVNGSLWTLKIEVMFYLVLPLLGWLLHVARSFKWWLIGAIYIGAEIWRYAFEHMGPTDGVMAEIGRQLPGQMSFFVSGIALYLVRNAINWRSLLLPVAVAALAVSFIWPGFEVLRAGGLAIVVVWAAIVAPRFMDAAEYGDLSYGLYIIHFPVIQVVASLGLFARPAQGTAIVLLAVLALSLAMWWLVERPFLRRDSAYRQAVPKEEPQPLQV